MTTRSYATLRAADLDWIIGTEYSPGRYILGCSQRLASCLRHSARTDILFRTFFVHFLDDIEVQFIENIFLLQCCYGCCAVAMRLLCGCYAVACFITFSVFFSFFPLFFAKLEIFLKKINFAKNRGKKEKSTENVQNKTSKSIATI